MIKVPSNRPEFAQFAKYFEEELGPFLASNEDARQHAVMIFGLIMIGAAVLIGGILVFSPFGDRSMSLAAFMGFGALAGGMFIVNRTRNKITDGLLQRVCSQFGFSYDRKPDAPESISVFRRLKLLPNHDRDHWEDEVRGARHGADFTICEGLLKVEDNDDNGDRTVFHGQLFVIDYHKEFLGETVVRRDLGMLNRLGKPGRDFQNVGIASPKFEKVFEAWSTDQVEARDLLDPLVLERFEELDRLFKGAKLRAAFSGGKLYMALNTGDKLNMGSMFKPLAGPERVNVILEEFDLVFDLIDIVLKQVDTRMDGAFSVDAVRSA
ncbi:MAG: DUF3137 domain-containing protein [Pseudomonadota bacterium]